jgi:hypothetical protein
MRYLVLILAIFPPRFGGIVCKVLLLQMSTSLDGGSVWHFPEGFSSASKVPSELKQDPSYTCLPEAGLQACRQLAASLGRLLRASTSRPETRTPPRGWLEAQLQYFLSLSPQTMSKDNHPVSQMRKSKATEGKFLQ